MLSSRLIRQLADSALLGRTLPSPCCRRTFSQCALTRRTAIASPPPVAAVHRHDSRPTTSIPTGGSARAASSSTRWKSRQGRDRYAKEAKVRGLKSRAAFKLLERPRPRGADPVVQMNQRYRLFRPGATVVDLGYAPGSWSQVAIDRTQPGGRVIGIDVIPAQPPRGVSTIQGNFLSEAVQAEVRAYVQDPDRGRAVQRQVVWAGEREGDGEGGEGEEREAATGYTEEELEEQERGYVDRERRAPLIVRPDEKQLGEGSAAESADGASALGEGEEGSGKRRMSRRTQDEALGRVVDVVLSDMSAPWDQTSGFYKRSITEPYLRMMNTSGMAFRDHAGSMDLCHAALTFAFDTLRTGGNFVCKFYQGAEDKALEKKLRRMFEKVFREKPESSRSESKEAFFVALKRRPDPSKEEVFREN
ncbi:FtsJ-like methyltransferase-domain-containing protein [Macrophomina phaseolina]|uniref:rRNA methyltransferase 2, mitochondrial n=1 Tax=Macrophomina phaseolina TaxID=35725 RepID=A0ABQ8GKN5_9PEZI|nr:FtsJ-like methyltransferase-domain-containing protein [Macrophomina phaseolina]